MDSLCKSHAKNVLISPVIMENQMDKKLENEMETAMYRIMWGL